MSNVMDLTVVILDALDNRAGGMTARELLNSIESSGYSVPRVSGRNGIAGRIATLGKSLRILTSQGLVEVRAEDAVTGAVPTYWHWRQAQRAAPAPAAAQRRKPAAPATRPATGKPGGKRRARAATSADTVTVRLHLTLSDIRRTDATYAARFLRRAARILPAPHAGHAATLHRIVCDALATGETA